MQKTNLFKPDYVATKPKNPKRLFFADLRKLKENTEIYFCRKVFNEIRREKRQFIRLVLDTTWRSDTGTSSWAIEIRDEQGTILKAPLRLHGAVRSRSPNGWKKSMWIELNTYKTNS